MSSITLVWRTDVHIADFAPSSRVDDWCETVLGKLTQVGEIAREVGAVAVLDGGDFFHVKSPGRNSHRMMQRVAECHSAYPCPVYGNIGNHDVKYGDWTFLPEAPLGVLFKTGVFHRCHDQHEAMFESNGYRVKVVGIPYHGTQYDMDRFRAVQKGNADRLVVMCHLLASREGGQMFEAEDIVKYADLPALCPDADVFCFGHWHKNQGIVQLDSGQWVVNVGSLTRGALTQDEMERVPVAVVMELGPHGIHLAERQLLVQPAAQVFNVEGRSRAEAREMTMEAFVAGFEASLAQASGKPLEDLIMESPSVPQEVKERALHYVEMQKRV